MKRFILIPFLALALLASGCKSGQTTISPALIQSGVASSVRYGVAKYPSSLPAVTAGVEVICSVGNGTNLAPAVIVAAIEASNFESLKTPEAVLIMDGIITTYSYVWNAYGAGAVSNSPVFKSYVQAVCNGGRQGLSPSLAAARDAELSWPHLK